MAASQSFDDINYGHFEGIFNVPAAIVFAVAYGLLLPFYIFRSAKHPTFVYIVLAVFCAIRITSFSIRAAIASSDSLQHQIGINIGYGVLSASGFFGLLYSAYTLVLDRELLLGPSVTRGFLTRVLQNRRAVRLVLTLAVALGVTGSNLSFYESTASSGRACRWASVIIFLAIIAALVIQTLMLAVHDVSTQQHPNPYSGDSVGETHGIFFLLPMVLLLLLRQAFYTATLNHSSASTNEHFFYPLSALPEILAVLLFAVPGLVPPHKSLETAERDYNINAGGGRNTV